MMASAVNVPTHLTLACTGCNPGLHLPIFGGLAEGVFSQHGIQLEACEPPGNSGQEGPELVAAGKSDFCLSAVTYFLLAQANASGPFHASFINVIYQRSALTAIVHESSDMTEIVHLGGRRAALSPKEDIWPGPEYHAALEERGIEPPQDIRVNKPYALEAFAFGEVDVLPRNVNILAKMRSQGFEVRGVPIPLDVYSCGVIAGGHVPPELAGRMNAALREALHRQRETPSLGLDLLSSRYPNISRQVALDQWSALQEYVFCKGEPGVMDALSWHKTISWLCSVHKIEEPEQSAVYCEGKGASPGPAL